MKKYLILFFVAAAAAFQSCNNNDDLWDAIDDLKSRVQALETQVDALNNNVEAMKALYNGGATISEVSETDGTYTLKLTNGTTLTLTQGSEAEAVIPVVSIDAQGNWQYSVDGGKSFIALNVNAEAEDGVTPQFRVDEATGLWQINTTGEESGWTNVKNTAGEDVSAVGGTVTDKFFDSVRTDGNVLYVKLLGSETELQIPIVADVLCEIVTTTEGIQMFDSGVERTFDVKMKGIDQAIVVAPEGWTARLTDPVEDVAKLYVKAPGALASAGTTATRATANSSQDVAILAMFGRYSCISKIQVQSTGIEAEPPVVSSVTPSATVLPTDVTLTFDVQVANADGWKYICQRSDAGSAPDAAKVFADGTTVLGSSVTVEGLEAQTEYTIYVVACIGEQYSEVATAAASTVADPNDYYLSGVMINGTSYNSTSQNVQLVSASKDFVADDFASAAVYFLENGDNAQTYTIQGAITSDQIFIGRYADSKITLTTNGNVNLNNPSATVAFKNLKIDMKNYFQMAANSGVLNLIFEDCEIDYGTSAYLITTGSNASAGSAHIGNIIFRNCKIHYTGTANTNFITANNTNLTGLSDFKSVIFENNLIYMAPQLKSSTLFNGNGNVFANLIFKFDHNTVINLLPNGGQASVLVVNGCAGLTSLTYNLYYSDPGITRGSNTAGFRVMVGSTKDVIGSAPVAPNVGYGVFSGTNGYINYQGGERITIETSPFSSTDYDNGIFVKTAEYADYGSTLE